MTDIHPFKIADDIDTADLWEFTNISIKKAAAICAVVADTNSGNMARDALLAAVEILDQAETLHCKLYAAIKPGVAGGSS